MNENPKWRRRYEQQVEANNYLSERLEQEKYRRMMLNEAHEELKRKYEELQDDLSGSGNDS